MIKLLENDLLAISMERGSLRRWIISHQEQGPRNKVFVPFDFFDNMLKIIFSEYNCAQH